MKAFLFAAVTLQLLTLGVLDPVPEKYEFGDIIAFPKGVDCGCQKFYVFKHYAVYVGAETIEGVERPADHDIFHFTGPQKPPAGNLIPANCVFAKMDKGLTKEKENYMDAYDWQKAPDPLIKKLIKEKNQKCSRYRPFTNNCEHLATELRYGVAISLQLETLGKYFVKNPGNRDIHAERAALDEHDGNRDIHPRSIEDMMKAMFLAKGCPVKGCSLCARNFKIKNGQQANPGDLIDDLPEAKIEKIRHLEDDAGLCDIICDK